MTASQSWTQTIFNWLGFARYNLSPPAGSENAARNLQCDSRGAMHVRVVGEGPEAGHAGASSWSVPAGNAYEAARSIKTSAGVLRHIEGFNNGASARYVQVFDSNGAPSANTVPKLCFYVGANQNFSWDLARGREFTAGIYVGVSSTGPGYTADVAATFFFVVEYV